MQHTFARGQFVLGEGSCRRYGNVRDVLLTIEAQPGSAPLPGVRSPFLNGTLRAEGTFVEECLPNRSLLTRGREAVLKLSAAGKWSLVGILVVALGQIRSPSAHERLYSWSFLVISNSCDALGLFPDATGNELSLADLLDLLGATNADVGRSPDGQRMVYDTEGGFRLQD